MPESNGLDTRPTSPTTSELFAAWKASWAVQGRGPSYQNYPTALMDPLTPEQLEAKNREDTAYAELIGNVASQVVEAAATGNHRDRIEQLYRELRFSMPTSDFRDFVPGIMRDVLVATVDMVTQPETGSA